MSVSIPSNRGSVSVPGGKARHTPNNPVSIPSNRGSVSVYAHDPDDPGGETSLNPLESGLRLRLSRRILVAIAQESLNPLESGLRLRRDRESHRAIAAGLNPLESGLRLRPCRFKTITAYY